MTKRLIRARMVQLGWGYSTLGAALALVEGRQAPFTRVTAEARTSAAPTRTLGRALGYNDAGPLLSGSSAVLNTPRRPWCPPWPNAGWPDAVALPKDCTRLRVAVRLEVLALPRDVLIGDGLAAPAESTLRYRLDRLDRGWPGLGRRAFLASLAAILRVEPRALIPGLDWSGLLSLDHARRAE